MEEYALLKLSRAEFEAVPPEAVCGKKETDWVEPGETRRHFPSFPFRTHQFGGYYSVSRQKECQTMKGLLLKDLYTWKNR